MRVERGFWLTLINRHTQRVMYQVATDALTEAEFSELWTMTGKAVYRELCAGKDATLEFEVRAQKLTS